MCGDLHKYMVWGWEEEKEDLWVGNEILKQAFCYICFKRDYQVSLRTMFHRRQLLVSSNDHHYITADMSIGVPISPQ